MVVIQGLLVFIPIEFFRSCFCSGLNYSQLLDCIPAVFHSGLNSRFFLQVFLLSMTDDRIPLVYYNKYQRNETKSNIL